MISAEILLLQGGAVVKKFTKFVLGIGLVILLISILSTHKPSKVATTCEDLQSEIIELSKENRNPFSAKILKLYDIKEVPSEEYVLHCRATAKWNRGDSSSVSFYIEEDKDGDRFIGYKAQ